MPTWIRNYEVLRELGSGHFGKVFLAVGEVPGRGLHPARRRVVAIKKLRDQGDPESLRLLLQEFALLDQVKHRGVVRVFEYLDEEHAVVMEYVHGVTLRTVIDDCVKSKEQVFTEAAIEIGCEIADALYQAWTTPGDNGERLQLVHRDLKPDNLILTPQGEVKVLDWGLARVDNADFAKENGDYIRGTPVYMAPEQARGGEIDHRTDLFALGLILYELLSNKAAYRLPTGVPDPVARVYAAIEAGEVTEAIRELEAKLPGTGPILARLLQVRPRNRYQTGQDLLVDLRRQLYKDRGAYLKEFCGFYFGSVHPLPEAPEVDAAQGGRMSSEKRPSIEERLAARARDAADDGSTPVAPKGAVPVRRVPKVAPSAPAPEPAPAARASPPSSPGLKITQRPSGSGKTEPDLDEILPPSVKGVKQPTPKASAPGGGGRKLVGARSPDETGMLQMVPLGSNDEKEAAADPSATQFFAIKAPPTERARAVAPPTPPAASPMASPGPPPAPGPYQPPVAAAPIPATPVLGQQAAVGAAPPVIYASGQTATPFQVAGPTPTQGMADESRTQSARVYVVLLVVFAMLGFGALGAAGAVWWFYQSQEKEEPVAAAPTPTPTPTPEPTPSEDVKYEPPQPAKPASTPKKTTTTTAAAPAEKPPPTSGTGTVNISISGTTATSVSVYCSSTNFQGRASISGGKASVPNVPVNDACKLNLIGAVASKATVVGGRSYSCTVTGTTLSCH